MKSEWCENERPAEVSTDRLAFSLSLLRIVFVFTALCLVAPVAGSIFCSAGGGAARVAGALNLNNLSVVPSGRFPRASDPMAAALGFSPFFQFDAAGTEFLLIDASGPAGESQP